MGNFSYLPPASPAKARAWRPDPAPPYRKPTLTAATATGALVVWYRREGPTAPIPTGALLRACRALRPTWEWTEVGPYQVRAYTREGAVTLLEDFATTDGRRARFTAQLSTPGGLTISGPWLCDPGEAMKALCWNVKAALNELRRAAPVVNGKAKRPCVPRAARTLEVGGG